MSISNSFEVIKKKIYYGSWVTLFIFCIFGMGDMQHPDGVTGASHRYSAAPPTDRHPPTPVPYPGQEPEPPVKPKISPPHAEQPSKPANILVSHPTMTPQPTEAPSPLTALPQAKAESQQNFSKLGGGHRKFAGAVGFVTNKNLDPGVLQKVSIMGIGELFNFIILDGTRFFEKDGTLLPTKTLAEGDQIVVIYDIYATGREDSENVAFAIIIK